MTFFIYLWKKSPFFGYIVVPLTQGAKAGGDKGLVSSKPPKVSLGYVHPEFKKKTYTLVRIQHGTLVSASFFSDSFLGEIIEFR